MKDFCHEAQAHKIYIQSQWQGLGDHVYSMYRKYRGIIPTQKSPFMAALLNGIWTIPLLWRGEGGIIILFLLDELYVYTMWVSVALSSPELPAHTQPYTLDATLHKIYVLAQGH